MHLTNNLRLKQNSFTNSYLHTKMNLYIFISSLIIDKKVKHLQNFINHHSNSTVKYHNSLCPISFGSLTIKNFSYAFDPCFEVLKKNEPFQITSQIISPLIKYRKDFSKKFIDDHSNSIFKDHNLLCLSSFGEMVIDNWWYAFNPCFEALVKDKPLQINQNFINNHYSSTFNDHNSLGLNSLGEFIIK